MEINRTTVRKVIIDYTCNTQECSLTLWYGFQSLTARITQPNYFAAYIFGIWRPALQNFLEDSGQVGGCRVYCPHEQFRGSGWEPGSTPATDETIENSPAMLAALFRCFQFDRPTKLQKKVYLPISRESSVVGGAYAPGGAQGTAATVIRALLSTRITMPGLSTSDPAIPVIRSTTAIGGGTPELPTYFSIESVIWNARPAQRRSRQLRGQWAYEGGASGSVPDIGPVEWLPLPNAPDWSGLPPAVVAAPAIPGHLPPETP